MPRHLIERYNEPLLHRYLELVYRYSDHIHRITDTVKVQDGTLRRELSVDLTIPSPPESAGAHSALSLVPLMRGHRGRLFDNLAVADASGRSLSVLAQEENKMVAALLLETTYKFALRDENLDVDHFDDIWRVGVAIATIPYLSPKHARWIYRKYFSDPKVLALLGLTDSGRDALGKLAYFLCDRFMTTAEVAAGPLDKVVLKYSYDSKYREDAQYRDTGSDTALKSQLRSAFGQRPYSFRIRIPLAFVAQSYHFRMDAPSSAYCSVQAVLVEAPKAPSEATTTKTTTTLQEWQPPGRLQYRKTESPASNYAHLYIHGLNRQKHFPLFARVIFYEVPPGSLGSTAIVSAATSLALVVVAALSGKYVSSPSIDTAIASLVVALPATVAFWLQPWPDRHELLTAPLASRLGLLGAGSLAYLGSLLLLIVPAVVPTGPIGRGILQAVFLFLALASLSCTSLLGRKWVTGLRRFRAAQTRSDVTDRTD
jgi:hypothetical protein